jgi:hypothetical protein
MFYVLAAAVVGFAYAALVGLLERWWLAHPEWLPWLGWRGTDVSVPAVPVPDDAVGYRSAPDALPDLPERVDEPGCAGPIDRARGRGWLRVTTTENGDRAEGVAHLVTRREGNDFVVETRLRPTRLFVRIAAGLTALVLGALALRIGGVRIGGCVAGYGLLLAILGAVPAASVIREMDRRVRDSLGRR